MREELTPELNLPFPFPLKKPMAGGWLTRVFGWLARVFWSLAREQLWLEVDGEMEVDEAGPAARFH